MSFELRSKTWIKGYLLKEELKMKVILLDETTSIFNIVWKILRDGVQPTITAISFLLLGIIMTYHRRSKHGILVYGLDERRG